MSSTDTPLEDRRHPQNRQHRISLVAGVILLVTTLLVSVTIFMVMERHAKALLSKSLQISLKNRIKLMQAEIEAGFDRATVIATRPLLMDQMQGRNASVDESPAHQALNTAVQSFLSTGFTAIALLDKEGRELVHAGSFAHKPVLTVPLTLPGRVQLIWDEQMLMHAVVEMKRGGAVIGTVIVETPLPGYMGMLKDATLQGDTGELALCAPFGLNMRCFPTTLNPVVATLSKRSSKGVALPMTYALEGQTGFITARDYRDQKVVAAYAPVGDLGLGMVLKMDSAELYAPVWAQLRYLIPLLVGVLVIAFLLLRWRLSPLVTRLVRSEAQAHAMTASLRDSERLERALLDNLDEGIVSISDGGLIERFNPAAERMFGYRSEDVVGKNISMLMPEPYHSEHDGYLARYLHGGPAKIIGNGTGREVAGRRSDGRIFPMDLRISEFFLGGRRQFIGSMRDITERKRIAEALHANELQLRQITDTVPVLIACLDLEQRFCFHNKAYEEVFGLRFDQIHGRTLAEVLGPRAYAGVRDKAQEVLRGYVVHYERLQVTPQGGTRTYAMHYFPRYGEGADAGKVLGFYAQGTDITEFKRIDRMKTEFISTVSHELRTPLTSIRGSLGLIAGGVAGELPEAARNLVAIAKNNCERLIRLINDILDSEKIESGKMSLDLQVVDIRPLVQQTLAAIEGFAGQHRVKLRLQAPDAALEARIDSDRLIQVLTNLLSNAVKFSPPGSTVDVNVLRVARQVRVEVVDRGPGIPEEFRSRIFQKFSQADSSDTRQKGGSGLGLNISRGLVEKMGGQIGFSSEAAAGTTFFLELPEWRDPARLSPPSRARAVFSGLRILVCEGDAEAARLIGTMLEKAGIEADIAHHATQAWAWLASNSYDAVMVDIKLPGQSGAAFISALHDQPRTSHVPVIVIAARVEEGLLRFNRKPLAVSDWLEKPIDENLLIRSIRRAVGSVHSGKPRILHVEDDPDVQHITEAIAGDFADFEFATTPDEARTWLRTQRFDLVLLDIGLRQGSGWELFDDIHALDPPPPVIVFSANDVDPAECRQAEAILIKARTSNTELLNTIQRVLQIPGDPGPTRPQPLS
ncbi:MAG: PAS domain S-box protein [Polaromonas sp.]|nr:PAS domain S-box protein [Polaromonas sp.]